MAEIKIPEELLIEHGIDVEHTTDEFALYLTFLNRTDYICNKIVEGVATWDDYPDEKIYRGVAREEIGKINNVSSET